MDKKLSTRLILIACLSFIVLSCGAGQLLAPAPNPTSTPFPTPTFYPTYTQPAASASLPKSALVGKWQEYWGVGEATDVNYNDIYSISLSGNDDLQMVGVGRPDYRFQEIVFDGRNLKVQLDNNGFLINYDLTFANDPTLLTGTASTSAGKLFRIVWAKLK